ncbi:high frequency lysogenization protein [Orbus hercynius]|uniref:High frequency lysogenization protein HflD homolog n=1 Tax=Orbus hercynius TaxID=593135 RepID=A0A495RIW4_9GAMM|nr:high frequency lysogenization protein HflD [Orbus hercynius]RKS87230.1 high frequency lysogenization protein [Orbus hercynius]
MNNKYHHIAIALGGVCQSAMLVPTLANTGQCDTTLYDVSLSSIFNTNPTSAQDVFGGPQNIKVGLEILIQLFNHNQKHNAEVIRYVFGALGVTHKLLKNHDALAKISQRLTRIESVYQSENNDTLFANHRDEISYSLAGIYCDIISPLTSKIRVVGKIEYLQNTLVQAKVRSALFGSVRAATLWHQVGGSRWQFLFARKNIVNAANDILR